MRPKELLRPIAGNLYEKIIALALQAPSGNEVTVSSETSSCWTEQLDAGIEARHTLEVDSEYRVARLAVQLVNTTGARIPVDPVAFRLFLTQQDKPYRAFRISEAWMISIIPPRISEPRNS